MWCSPAWAESWRTPACCTGASRWATCAAIALDQTGELKVIVKLSILDTVKIRKDAKFIINQSGLLGDRYVDIIPVSATAEGF
jgi:hypothetical protein